MLIDKCQLHKVIFSFFIHIWNTLTRPCLWTSTHHIHCTKRTTAVFAPSQNLTEHFVFPSLLLIFLSFIYNIRWKFKHTHNFDFSVLELTGMKRK